MCGPCSSSKHILPVLIAFAVTKCPECYDTVLFGAVDSVTTFHEVTDINNGCNLLHKALK